MARQPGVILSAIGRLQSPGCCGLHSVYCLCFRVWLNGPWIAAGSEMRQSGRFRQAVPTATLDNPLDGRLQIYSVANRDVDGLDARPGSQHCAQDISLVSQHGVAACLNPRDPVFTYETRLCAAYCRYVEKQTQM